MEPVTHLLTGACLARSGLNRRAKYATAAMVVAAEFPDIDTIWSLHGPVAGLEHHRGLTHTFLGSPFEAGLLLLGFYGLHQVRLRSVRHQATPETAFEKQEAAAPVRWRLLFLFLLLSLLSHILLDYTNNYGIRPLFPFDPHWYAGSFVFIFDPLLFIFLVAGLTLQALFELMGREIGAPRDRFRGRGWARAALVGVVLLWAIRWFEHRQAVVLAQNQTLRAPFVAGPDAQSSPRPEDGVSAQPPAAPQIDRSLLTARRSLASPDPLSIFRWYTATDFGAAQRIGVADTRVGSLTPGPILASSPTGTALFKAENTHLGRVYLDWSPMPIVTLRTGPPEEDDADFGRSGSATVTFSDPRFMGDTPLLHSGSRPPLTGEVVLDASGHVIAQGLDGRFGR